MIIAMHHIKDAVLKLQGMAQKKEYEELVAKEKLQDKVFSGKTETGKPSGSYQNSRCRIQPRRKQWGKLLLFFTQ
jgi:hypothetical protein